MDAGRSYETSTDQGPCVHVPPGRSLRQGALTAVVVDDADKPGSKCVVTIIRTPRQRGPRPSRPPEAPAPDDWLVSYQKHGRDQYVPVPRASLQEKIAELVEVEHVPHSTIWLWRPVPARTRIVFDVEGEES